MRALNDDASELPHEKNSYSLRNCSFIYKKEAFHIPSAKGECRFKKWFITLSVTFMKETANGGACREIALSS
ncbi:hypothetical protein ACEQPO_08780 [Bacillus sp. SL00103]